MSGLDDILGGLTKSGGKDGGGLDDLLGGLLGGGSGGGGLQDVLGGLLGGGSGGGTGTAAGGMNMGALAAALAAFRTSEEGYRLRNRFRYVIATV